MAKDSKKNKKSTSSKSKSKEVEVKKTKKVGKEGKVKANDKESKGKKVSPLEAARLAKASGKGGKAKKSKKKPLPIWKAPEDFKPHFLEVLVKTEKDGLLCAGIKATRYQGKYDPNADEKKKFELASYDQATLTGIISRLSAVTYKANVEKRFPEEIKGRVNVKGAHRLPANTQFRILLRIGKKSADSSLTAGVKMIAQAVKQASGRVKAIELDKKDPVYRALRKASRILPAAFKDVKAPPKKVRGKKQKDEDEE